MNKLFIAAICLAGSATSFAVSAQTAPPPPPRATPTEPSVGCRAVAAFATAALAYVVGRRLGGTAGASAGAAAAGADAAAQEVGQAGLAAGCESTIRWLSDGYNTSNYQNLQLLEDWEQTCDLGPCAPLPVRRSPGMSVSANDLYGEMLDNSGWRDSWLLVNNPGGGGISTKPR